MLKNFELLRIYWYDAPPSSGLLKNPIDQTELNLANTQIHAQHASLLDKLELQPNLALRLGETLVRSWRLGDSAFKEMVRSPRQPVAKDFVPDIEQKGVDLRIGLDIARLSLKRMVDVIVIATGDSDLIPAFKFARREGVRLYLDHLGLNVRRELKAHADIVLDTCIRDQTTDSVGLTGSL